MLSNDIYQIAVKVISKSGFFLTNISFRLFLIFV